MSDREQLLSFGFPTERVDWALKSTNNRGLQAALDFLVENEDKPVPADGGASAPTAKAQGGDGEDEDEDDLRAALGLSMATPSAEAGSSSGAGGGGGGGAAQSIKCSICGKIFRDTSLANFHAEKSGHDQFEESAEEIKPLTEEEKKERLAELRQRALEKKSVKSIEEAKEAKANEALRRKAGQDKGAALEALKLKEAEMEVQRKKNEKLADQKARAAIKAQIEADKRERAEKTAREKAIRDGQPVPESSARAGPSTPTAPTVAPSGVKGSDYKDTRLQIRLSGGGPPLTTTLPSDSTLREVAEFVAGQSLAYSADSITFTMQFPRKTFSPSDYGKSLRTLGLTPSAVLIAS